MQLTVTEYFTTAPCDISYGGNTYLSTNRLMSVSNIKESMSPTVGTATITMSGIDSSNISIMLTENFVDAPVIISMVILDENNTTLLVKDIFTGGLQDPSLSEDRDSGTATIVWACTGFWATFEQKGGMYCNINDHQRHYPGDTFFKYADQSQREVKWGRN